METPKRDFRQEVTDGLVRMLENGVAPWQKPWEAVGMPINPTTGNAYRGGNSIHLMARGLERGYGDPRWMTYRQAAEHGWQVRQGEKGTQIEFWDVKPATEVRPEPEPETERQGRFIHRVYTVFNARQIDGVPAYEPKRPSAIEAVHSGEQILENSGARIHHDQADRAFYNRSSDSIHLPPKEAFKAAAGYFGTALHELAHWSGHPSRLNRSTLNESYRFGDMNYAKEELRAELASLFLAADRGIPHDPEQHAAYVGSWIKTLKDDKHEIFRAAHDASKAADYVLALERGKSLADMTNSSEELKIAHAVAVNALGNSASLVQALADSGTYRGPVIGTTEHYVVQRQSPQMAVVHERGALDAQPEIGQKYTFNYSAGKAIVQQTREHSKDNGLGR